MSHSSREQGPTTTNPSCRLARCGTRPPRHSLLFPSTRCCTDLSCTSRHCTAQHRRIVAVAVAVAMAAGPSFRHSAARVSIATHGVQGVTCRASRLKAACCCWLRSTLACDALTSSRCEARSQINRTSGLSCRVGRHRQMASADPRPGLIPHGASSMSQALLGIACRGGDAGPLPRTANRSNRPPCRSLATHGTEGSWHL